MKAVPGRGGAGGLPVCRSEPIRAEDWHWSSARAHLDGRDDGIVSVAPLAAWIEDFAAFLSHPEDEAAMGEVRRSASTGRPAGAADWLADLEKITARTLARERRGPKPKPARNGDNLELFPTVSPSLRAEVWRQRAAAIDQMSDGLAEVGKALPLADVAPARARATAQREMSLYLAGLAKMKAASAA